jgi:hypothetical protein
MKTIFVIIFLFYIIYWDNPQHYIIKKYIDKTRFILWYLGLWHSWNMFRNPYHNNKTIIANIVYIDDTTQSYILYDPEYNTFLDKPITSYDTKILDNFINDTKNQNIRKMLCDYLVKNYFNKTSAVKSLEIMIEYEDILLPNKQQTDPIKLESVYTTSYA